MTITTVQIGDATLYHADCRAVLPTLPRADLIATDPPYGINYQSNHCKSGPRFDRLEGDTTAQVAWLPLAPDADAIVVFCEWRNADVFRRAIESAGWPVKSQLVWDRIIHGMGDLNAAWSPQHDLAWWACRPSFSFPEKRPSTVLRFQRVDPAKMQHPTEKPVELMEHIVCRSTTGGATVLDPFMGSGSTGVACVNAGRCFIGIEIDKAHFDTAVRRIEEAYAARALFEPQPERVETTVDLFGEDAA